MVQLPFLIVKGQCLNETYYVKAEDVICFVKESKRHSIPYRWFQDNGHLIPSTYVTPIDYLRLSISYTSTQEGNNDNKQTKKTWCKA